MLTDNNSTGQTTQEADEIDSSQAEIDACWMEVKTRRKHVMRLFAEGKIEEAIEKREQNKYMIEELNSLIKDFLLYKKYVDTMNKGKSKGKFVPMSVSQQLKNEPSSQGRIVAEVPKH